MSGPVGRKDPGPLPNAIFGALRALYSALSANRTRSSEGDGAWRLNRLLGGTGYGAALHTHAYPEIDVGCILVANHRKGPELLGL